MIENYIKEADRVTYLMPKEVDHHCAGQIIAELDALIEGCGVRKIVYETDRIYGQLRHWCDNRKNKEA